VPSNIWTGSVRLWDYRAAFLPGLQRPVNGADLRKTLTERYRALSKAEGAGNLAQHFTCRAAVDAIIEGLVEPGEQRHTKSDNREASQHNFFSCRFLQVGESTLQPALPSRAYTCLTSRTPEASEARR
jgi:hypothetical protein